MDFCRAVWSEVNDTTFQGRVHATYSQLVEVFGEPDGDWDDKTQAEWDLRFADGTIATVYDWKEYLGPEEVTMWHIGGFSPAAIVRVKAALMAAAVRARK